MNLIPTVIEKTQYGERAYDIYSRLLKDRIVFLGSVISDVVANSIIAQMLFLASQDSKKDIQFYINSPVSTVCIGMAASFGAVLLAAGEKGKRFALPNSQIMLHQPMGGVQGQATEIEITAKQIVKIKERLNTILAKHTNQPYEKMERDTDRDFYLDAMEAKAYGIIDEVIQPKV